MKVFVLITAAIEILAGLIMLFVPGAIPDLAGADVNTLVFVRMYGAGAITVALFALAVWKNFENLAFQDMFVRGFTVFHIGVTLANIWGYNNGAAHCLKVAILHGVLALITLFFFTTYRKG